MSPKLNEVFIINEADPKDALDAWQSRQPLELAASMRRAAAKTAGTTTDPAAHIAAGQRAASSMRRTAAPNPARTPPQPKPASNDPSNAEWSRLLDKIPDVGLKIHNWPKDDVINFLWGVNSWIYQTAGALLESKDKDIKELGKKFQEMADIGQKMHDLYMKFSPAFAGNVAADRQQAKDIEAAGSLTDH